MVCLIEQESARVVSWFVAPTLEELALHCRDKAVMAEILADPKRYGTYGNYQLQGGKYTLLVGSLQ
jgi:hypothetical protein